MKVRNNESMKKGFFPFFLMCGLLVLIGLSGVAMPQEGESDKLTVYVVNYPLKYFAERIAGEHAIVVFPAPADEDPAYWKTVQYVSNIYKYYLAYKMVEEQCRERGKAKQEAMKGTEK